MGDTPIVRLNSIGQDVEPEITTKLEFLNPGGSVKDRIGPYMIEKGKREGELEPGGTIIEGTSGNTGVGLAMTAALEGYKVIFTIQDKQSREKIDLLKAYGAEVIVCPTAVEPDDPRSYYSVAEKLDDEIPNSYYPNQYENPANPRAHYETTGPEIWEQTDGEITHFVVGLGTGGTVSGAGSFLKEQNPDIEVIGVDPEGSLYKEYFETGELGEAETYQIERIGEDMIPGTIDFSVVDDVVQVNDRESFLMARRLAKDEAIFAGGSSGSAVAGALKAAEGGDEDDLYVVILPDTGHRNLGKVFNDEWMKENQFLEPSIRMTAGELLKDKDTDVHSLIHVKPETPLQEALDEIKDNDISQLPVFEDGRMVGSILEDQIIDQMMMGKDLDELYVREVMGNPFPEVDEDTPVEEVADKITPETPAVLVRTRSGRPDIITKYDIIHAIRA